MKQGRIKKYFKYLLIRFIVCILLAVCIFSAKWLNAESAIPLKEAVNYSIDFSKPIESLKGFRTAVIDYY